MTMIGCSATPTRAQWFSMRFLFSSRLLPLRLVLSAGLVLSMGAASATEVGLNDLGQGITAYNSRDFNGAISHLRSARGVNQLSDYVTYHLAYSQMLTGDVDGALALLTAYRANPQASSPLAGKIDLLYGRTLLAKRDPELSGKALNSLQTDYKLLPEPDGDFALGLAYEAVGEQPQAALSYSRVYYSFPNTDLAAQSSTALERLRTALGKDFPTAPARQQLDRCEKWLTAKEYGKARQEYTTLAETLSGVEKDEARVGIAVAEYLSGSAPQAMRDLKALHPAHSEADAKRLYYLSEAAGKAGDDTEVMDAVKQLAEHYPQSVWRLKTLVDAGNRYLVTNDRDNYLPLFKAAADTFPPDNSTAYCHWKVTWDAYLADKPERVMLLREQIEKYPDDSRAGTALYFLGRIAELNLNYAEARAYFDKLSAQYPHYFYGVLARQRTRDKVAAATPDEDVVTWLHDIDWPAHRDLSASTPNTSTQQRIVRARLLRDAGLQDVAESELRFGASNDTEQPQLLALELAQSADSPFRALRIMKSFSADYLSLPLDQAPTKFWQMLFPLPYKDDLFMSARDKGLDPYDVAALIRQESEFNPGAKSRANAYGLMQLMPATGRMVGRQEGMGVISTRSLLNPAVSIKLGTHYLRQQLDSWDGDMFRTLAAYNAGPGRVHQWLNWSNYREPAEFVESIPFTETREYVQAVLRNADIYRQLYSGRNLPELQLTGTKPPVKLASLVTAGARPVPAATPVAEKAAVKKILVSTSSTKPVKSTTASAKKPVSSKSAPAKKAVASRRSPQKKHEPA
jgi:soluble lytic murein transglycosylase